MFLPRVLLSVCVVMQPASSSSRLRISIRSNRMRCPLVLPFADIGAAPGAVGDLPGQLAAGSVDVVAAGAPQHGQHAGIEQLRLEVANVIRVRTLVAGTRAWVGRNQIDLSGRPLWMGRAA